MKVKYTLERPYPGVYLCKIKDRYDLAMTFCRVQEFYESSFKKIRGKKFKLVDFMEIYSKANDDCFTYSIDWAGFNVPGAVVAKLYELGIDDYNKYDRVIEDIHNLANKEIDKKNNYYLIGSNNNRKTIEHELCHAFYTLDGEYKTAVKAILKKMRKSVYKKLAQSLISMGYATNVLLDEIQAYLITDFAMVERRIKLTKTELCNITDIGCELRHIFKGYRKKVKF